MSANAGKTPFAWRYYVVVILLMCLGVGIIARVVHLTVLEREFLQTQGDRRTLRSELIPAYRGVIEDRNGEPLAVSTPVVSLWANPQVLIHRPADWPALAAALAMPEADLAERLEASSDRQFIYLKRHLPPHKADDVLALEIAGVHGQTEYRRYYPAGEVAAHVVGFTDIDEQGKEGLERAFNSVLEGTPGSKRVIKDLFGRTVKDVGLVRNAESGRDIQLSIDMRAQYMAYRELLTAIKEFRAEAGSIVALDIQTGEVLATANAPSYNPNNRQTNDVPFFRNRAITDVLEPGSTVKPLTVAAALESGQWQVSSQVDTTPGFLRIGSKRIRDSGNYGVIDLPTLIAKSSNVGSAKLALSLAPGALSDMFGRVGLGELTGIGFPGEASGMVPYRERWRSLETATLSYGYGLSVTALQLAQAYATLGSHGIKRPVSLLKVDEPQPGTRVMDKHIAEQVLAMLEKATSDHSTGHRAQVSGYRVAGKTGTVHKIGRQGYKDDQYLSLFAGVAPATRPRIAMVVVIDNPRGDQYYGGQVSAPVFARVMAGLLRVMQVPPDQHAGELLAGHYQELTEVAR